MAGMNGGSSMRVGNPSDRETAARAANDLERKAPSVSDVELRDDVVTFRIPDKTVLPSRVMAILSDHDMMLARGCMDGGCVGTFKAVAE